MQIFFSSQYSTMVGEGRGRRRRGRRLSLAEWIILQRKATEKEEAKEEAKGGRGEAACGEGWVSRCHNKILRKKMWESRPRQLQRNTHTREFLHSI